MRNGGQRGAGVGEGGEGAGESVWHTWACRPNHRCSHLICDTYGFVPLIGYLSLNPAQNLMVCHCSLPILTML